MNSCHEDVGCRALDDHYQTTYLIWLRRFAVAQECWKSKVGLAITANNVGETRIANFWFINAVMARIHIS